MKMLNSTKRSLGFVATLVCSAFMILPGVSLDAQQVSLMPPAINFDDDGRIDDPNWTTAVANSARNHPFENATLHGREYLTIYRRATETGEPSNFGTNFGHVTYNQQFSDVTGSVIIGQSGWGTGHTGVWLRAANQLMAADGYYLAAINTGLQLLWKPGNTNTWGQEPLAVGALLNGHTMQTLTAANDNEYKLEFQFIGNTLEASLWAVGKGSGGTDLLVSTLSYVDERANARSEGYLGVKAGAFGGVRTGYFRDFEVHTVIPEPGSVAMLLIGAVAGLCLLRRQRS